MTKVSVIVPVYNVAKFLPECLDSIRRQTLKDIEIICVDDGSVDNSLEILNKFAHDMPNLKIIAQKNQGAGMARNTALKTAVGEFVAFLDPDDYYQYEDNLETLYNACVQNNVKISGGCFATVFENIIDTKIFDTTFFGYEFKEDGVVEYKNWQYDYGYTRFLYNRKFLIENNLFFPNNRRFEDPIFFVRAMYLAQRFYGLKKYTYLYRVGHKKTNWSRKVMHSVLTGIEQNLEFAKEKGLDTLYYLTAERFNQHCRDFESSFIAPDVALRLYLLRSKINVKICRKTKAKFRLRNPLLKQFLHLFYFDYPEGNHKVYRILGIKIKKEILAK